VRSDSALLSWSLTDDISEPELMDSLRLYVSQKRGMSRSGVDDEYYDKHGFEPDRTDARRIIWRQCWERDDPIVQLVPGASTTYSTRLTSGISNEVLQEFSSSIGIGAKISVVDLTATLSNRLSRKMTMSTEIETTSSLQLSNPREGFLRRIAVWHPVNMISVDKVAWAAEPAFPEYDEEFFWRRLTEIEVAGSGVQQTFIDVPA
jgi:hypothetical protein